ncbi:MAG TPA: iron chelate uptake ABC transporter family permease subunit, partial [Polyangiaceae bacterium]|nr:iron chelate uptake ABC transporter family permease subunit [Polyangiaceae bacterium]
CAVVGVYMILRRVVFLPAALSQVSGLGVVFAFLLPTLLGLEQGTPWTSPELVAGVVTLAASLLLGWMPEPRRLSRDAVIGVAYVLASALMLIIGDRIPQDSHDINDILFGNAVAVETGQMVVALVVAGVVLSLHGWLMRPFLLVSFDSPTAKAHGVPVRVLDTVLFLTVGLTISVATKTIGAMPVFAFAVLPAAAGLSAFSDMRKVFLFAAGIGAASAFLGYWISFVGSVPTGPCMAVVTALFLLPAVIAGRLWQGKR